MAQSPEEQLAEANARRKQEDALVEAKFGKYAAAKHRRHNIYALIVIYALALAGLKALVGPVPGLEGIPSWFWACAILGSAVIQVMTAAALGKFAVFLYRLFMAVFVDKDIDSSPKGE